MWMVMAVLAEGTTTIYNAACEPYLQQLCALLNRMGAKITGIGSNLLTIEGVARLNGTTHRVLPDMIEIGSWIDSRAYGINHKIRVLEALGQIPSVFRKLGIQIEQQGDDMFIQRMKRAMKSKVI